MPQLDPEQKEQIKALLARKENVLCRQGIATKEMLQAMSAAIRAYNTKIAKIKMEESEDTDVGDLGISTPQREIRDEEIQGLIQAALEDPNSEAFQQLPQQLQNYVQELIKARAKAQDQKEQEAEIKSKTDAEADVSRPNEKLKAGYRPRPQR